MRAPGLALKPPDRNLQGDTSLTCDLGHPVAPCRRALKRLLRLFRGALGCRIWNPRDQVFPERRPGQNQLPLARRGKASSEGSSKRALGFLVVLAGCLGARGGDADVLHRCRVRITVLLMLGGLGLSGARLQSLGFLSAALGCAS